jgi:short-subunit dehydrogenase
LVAGGSQGIGLAFARGLAARGYDLVLVANDGLSLDDAVHELQQRVKVVPVLLDLTEDDAIDQLQAAVGDRDVEVLVVNAALSPIGAFLDVEEELLARTVRLNAEVPLRLAHRYGKPMRERARGAIVLLSSLSGLQGTALLATYAATKAFSRVLAEGLWDELRGSGVQVVAVMPGTTDTPGLRASAPQSGPRPMPAQQVADEVLTALARGPVVVPGRMNKLTAVLTSRILPRRRAVRLIGATTRKMYPHVPGARRAPSGSDER